MLQFQIRPLQTKNNFVLFFFLFVSCFSSLWGFFILYLLQLNLHCTYADIGEGPCSFLNGLCPVPTLNVPDTYQFSNILICQDGLKKKNFSRSGSLNQGTTFSIITVAMLQTTWFNVLHTFLGQSNFEDGKDETSVVRMMAASVAPCIKTIPTKFNQNKQNIPVLSM